MKKLFLKSILFICCLGFSESVYVETTLDTDNDGKKDLIYVSYEYPSRATGLPTILHMSPYSSGGNPGATFHDVNMRNLPQNKPRFESFNFVPSGSLKYVSMYADSLGTGSSGGCPSVGGYSEALAGKSIIDWLNGRARAFDSSGNEVKASWSNGLVGMYGVSYNGTLPTMIASTGVEELKAIVPMAAISNWYNYYRANGLVVSPGGYVGEDADTLGMYIVRPKKCSREIKAIARNMGRSTGDYTHFWKERDYVSIAHRIKAATLIIHGQADWNVKQRHAIDLWHALEDSTPKKMFLHSGGHTDSGSLLIQRWFDHHLYGVDNGVMQEHLIQVNTNAGVIKQYQWPHEGTSNVNFFMTSSGQLTRSSVSSFSQEITDEGRTYHMKEFLKSPESQNSRRLAFLSSALKTKTLLSGAPILSLNLRVLNKRSANITAYLVDYKSSGRVEVITRGWADPQNYRSLIKGELLDSNKVYPLRFELEPKQYVLNKGSRIGLILASTDHSFTMRPKPGTRISFEFDQNSSLNLKLGSL